MGRICIRARRGERQTKDEKRVLCACQEEKEVVHFKTRKNCGPPSIEVTNMMDSSKEKMGTSTMQMKDQKLSVKQQAPISITSKEQDQTLASAGDENLHAKLEAIIRSSGYGSAAWIIETSKLFI